MTSDDPVAAANDIADRAKGAVKGTADSAKSRLDATAGSVADRASEAAGKVSDKVADVYQRVSEGAAGLGDKLPGSAGDAVEAGKRAYAKSSDHVARQIGRQPIEALLLAGAIGYLVGWAANRS